MKVYINVAKIKMQTDSVLIIHPAVCGEQLSMFFTILNFDRPSI